MWLLYYGFSKFAYHPILCLMFGETDFPCSIVICRWMQKAAFIAPVTHAVCLFPTSRGERGVKGGEGLNRHLSLLSFGHRLCDKLKGSVRRG